MDQILSEKSRELELVERELQELEVHTNALHTMSYCHILYTYLHVNMCSTLIMLSSFSQPLIANALASLDQRSSSVTKVQNKINKVEDEVRVTWI